MARTELGSELKRGTSEVLILSILEDRPRHGYEIAKLIERRSGGLVDFHVASLYPMLYRMEQRRWVRGAWETTSSGRRRRCYRLTRQGKKKLQPLRAEWSELFTALRRLSKVSNA